MEKTYTVPVRLLAYSRYLATGKVDGKPIRVHNFWEQINDFFSEFRAEMEERGALEEPASFFEIVIRAQASVLDVSELPDDVKEQAKRIRALPGDPAYIIMMTRDEP